MNITRDIIQYLDTNTAFTVGVDLFQANLPDTNSNGVIIEHSGQYETESFMQGYVLYVTTHYDDYDSANDACETIYNLLAFSNGLTIASGEIHNSTPMKLPGFVTITDQNKYIFSCSILCHITRP